MAGEEGALSRLLSLFTFEFLESLAHWLVLPKWVHSGTMLAEPHQHDFSLPQQAKSRKYSSVDFCVASSGTNIKLRIIMRRSAWGPEVSILAYFNVSGPSLPFHPHLARVGMREKRRQNIEHIFTQGWGWKWLRSLPRLTLLFSFVIMITFLPSLSSLYILPYTPLLFQIYGLFSLLLHAYMCIYLHIYF